MDKTATMASTDSRHDIGEFGRKMEHISVGDAEDGHGDLQGVHEHVCMIAGKPLKT